MRAAGCTAIGVFLAVEALLVLILAMSASVTLANLLCAPAENLRASDHLARAQKAHNKNPNSIAGHTGPGLPEKIDILTQKYGEINLNSDTTYGSHDAVQNLKGHCGWDPATSSFDKNPGTPYNHYNTTTAQHSQQQITTRN